jgi:uncharacterized protein
MALLLDAGNPLIFVHTLTTPLVIFLLASGFGVGFLSGFVGVAGGLFTVSALVLLAPYLLGTDLLTAAAATGVAAVQGVASTVSGSLVHWRNGALNLKWMLWFGVASVAGSYVGTRLSATMSQTVILTIMASLLVVAIGLGFRKVLAMGKKTYEPPPALERSKQFKWPWWLTQPLLFGIGILSGILGIGGAVLLVPLMSDGLGMPLRQAIITATGSVVLTSIGTLVGKVQVGLVPWETSVLVSILAFAGGWLGAKAQAHISAKALRLFHIGLMLVMLAETLHRLA